MAECPVQDSWIITCVAEITFTERLQPFAIKPRTLLLIHLT